MPSTPPPSPKPHYPVGNIRTTKWTKPTTPFGPLVELTLLGRADEVPDTTNTAIILALRFVQLHAHPLATGKLRGPAEPQCARLRKQEDMVWGGHDRSLAHGHHSEVDEGAPGSNLSSDITIYWLYDLTPHCVLMSSSTK